MYPEPSTPPTPSTPRNKMTRKPSFSIFPLTPPQSSHSSSHPQTYTPPRSPIFSEPRTSTLTPASTPPRSIASPFPLAQMEPLAQLGPMFYPVRKWHGPLPDPNLPKYYDTKSGHLMTYYINNDLLRVVALIAEGVGSFDAVLFNNALNMADGALALATQFELWDMVSKCHLYRTYCFMHMKRWGEARQAVTKAATIRSWGDRIETIMYLIEQGEDEEEMRRRGLLLDEVEIARKLSFSICVDW